MTFKAYLSYVEERPGFWTHATKLRDSVSQCLRLTFQRGQQKHIFCIHIPNRFWPFDIFVSEGEFLLHQKHRGYSRVYAEM